MTDHTLPLSPAHGAALARVAELRTDAMRHQLVRATRARRRRTPAWPPRVAAALRESLTAALPTRRGTRRPACTTC